MVRFSTVRFVKKAMRLLSIEFNIKMIDHTCFFQYKYFSGDNNRLIIHELQATIKLFKLMSHNDKTVQRNATMAFGALSGNGTNLSYRIYEFSLSVVF